MLFFFELWNSLSPLNLELGDAAVAAAVGKAAVVDATVWPTTDGNLFPSTGKQEVFSSVEDGLMLLYLARMSSTVSCPLDSGFEGLTKSGSNGKVFMKHS